MENLPIPFPGTIGLTYCGYSTVYAENTLVELRLEFGTFDENRMCRISEVVSVSVGQRGLEFTRQSRKDDPNADGG